MLQRDVSIPIDGARLPGSLSLPERGASLIIFAHGSGSSRRSPRNRAVADHLNHAGLGTLLFDLLTEREAEDRSNVFDVRLLAGRLRIASDWAQSDDLPPARRLGYFGASTGAAAALVAAADDPRIGAVVSRGGRPDLAVDALSRVSAPTLLIVGGADRGVIELNENALAQLRCEKEMSVIPNATHLFEEPGALDDVARRAAAWFKTHLD